MDRSGNESLSHHASPTEPSSKRIEAARNVIIAFRGLAKELLPILHLDVISKYIPKRAAPPKMLPAEVHTWRVPLFFPEEDFAADAIHAIVSSAKAEHDREQQLSVNNSNIVMAGVTATGTTTIGNSSFSMAQEAAASTTSGTTSTPSQEESEPFDDTTSSQQPLMSDEEREARWELQERKNELRLQQFYAQRDKIKETYDQKKAKVEADYKSQQEEPSMWKVRNLTELEEQLREVSNRLWRRIAMEKEWEREEEEEGGEDDESDYSEEKDDSDEEEDDEEEWDSEAAKRRIHSLETRKRGQAFRALCHRVQIQDTEAELRRSEREQKKVEGLLEVEEEYNREMQAWAMRIDAYERDMYAWYKMRDEYKRRKIEEEQRH